MWNGCTESQLEMKTQEWDPSEREALCECPWDLLTFNKDFKIACFINFSLWLTIRTHYTLRFSIYEAMHLNNIFTKSLPLQWYFLSMHPILSFLIPYMLINSSNLFYEFNNMSRLKFEKWQSRKQIILGYKSENKPIPPAPKNAHHQRKSQ